MLAFVAGGGAVLSPLSLHAATIENVAAPGSPFVVTALGASDFEARPNGTWKSPASGIVYPVDWTISLPSRGVRLKVEPVLRASEIDARTTTLNVYWEGSIKSSGSHSGVGFMELSGYSPPSEQMKNRGQP